MQRVNESQQLSELNGTQKNIIEGTLSFIFSELEDVQPSHALRILAAMIAPNLSVHEIVDFKAEGYWEGIIEVVRAILSHPCPQNKGFLNLTARNDNTASPVTKDAVVQYLHHLIQQETQKYVEKYAKIKPLDDVAKKIQFWHRQNQMPKFLNCIDEVKTSYKKESYISSNKLEKIKSFPGFHYMIANIDVNENNYDIFHVLFISLIEEGNIRTINAFLKNKFINPAYIKYWGANPPEQITALSTAAYHGHAELVKIFLKLGVDCNTVNTSYTPFIWAVRKGHLEAVKAFLEEKSFNELIVDQNDHKKLQSALFGFRSTNYIDPIKNQEKNRKFQQLTTIIQEAQEVSHGLHMKYESVSRRNI